MAQAPPLAPDFCPLCGELNRCAMEAAREAGTASGPCWCTQVDFSADLLARVPPEARRLACICEACSRAQPQ